MTLERLTSHSSQLQPIANLERLTSLNELERNYQAFLLSCQVSGLSPATIRYYQYMIGAFINFCLQTGITTLQEITTTQVRLFLLKLQQTNNSISVHDYYRAVKRFFNWLIEEGIAKKSPLQTIKPPKQQVSLVKPFSNQDIHNMLALFSGDSFLELRNRAMILLFLDTGLRLAELANIKIGEIDVKAETIKVMGKGARQRLVRMGKTTQMALLRYMLSRKDQHRALWVTEEFKPMTRDGVRITIVTLCHRANIQGAKCGPHTFRHTAAIHYLRNGGSEFTLQIMLGHSTLKMTRRYVSSLGAEDMIKAHQAASPVDNMRLK